MILKLSQDSSATLDAVKKIPEKPGVYSFLDGQKRPLYIGKAINLKNRALSHVRNKKENLFKKSKFLRIAVFDSGVAALIKESELIKKFQPKLNVVFRDDKQYFHLCFTDEDCPRINVLHQKKGFCLGPFTDGKTLKNSLNLVRKTFSFCTCKTTHLRRCLNSQIGLCFGFCCKKYQVMTRAEKSKYQANIKKIKKIFSGKDRSLKKEIEKVIKISVKDEDFEKAQMLKLQLIGLEKIFSHQEFLKQSYELGRAKHDYSPGEELKKLTGLKKINRIEFYDSSQLQGSNRVAAMTVWERAAFNKNQWRLFKIKNEKAVDDLAMLKEVFERRQKHPDWQEPSLIIVDGGKNQLKIARNTIKDKKIKMLALQKNIKHAPEQLLILQPNRKSVKIINLKSISHPLKNFLEDFSAKTHGFAVRFHRKSRDKFKHE
ncbi:MAG: hypothetical protein A2418_01130 [Candidatus Brennerbacteria bacterium RIFOXYC1_FULL_41_11]|uniref:Excinuclease ABC subunit C n=1 Tax=Candidatus Brennerbacteria bacterium RIFOXYD1_FULL_41_16 TaxID=1797529 RepID=A0A1G1XNR7_9BACT|nr:MAG: Excinuclease ABC subunit C [Parcubacteria group bacterium GW2011_GWB1_41_4]OGY39411.1 MAG: hypothetical protein A2391_03000 [Candidatus Brennerbacteria bacterium RIFOXYB1_FULL_41_13]OGY40045.1 MAG: hypothetical protein A2418_01130 [Candidatus Brennerbacteria bacterium RIFOXYC1_FULL_41_11]OGY40977.1 MAG: hypothetical protein A2570_00600 [Candidatus Brennerbacteria bacterium RIFOXYD1_FULL_41_16]